MTDPQTPSCTFSGGPTPAQKRPEPELFAVDKLSAHGLSSEQLLARNPRTGGELVMPGDHFKTLVDFCSAFRTLDEHVAELMAGSDGSPQRAAAIAQVVQSFRDAGLTLSAAEVCQELAPVPAASRVAEKPMVVAITCDRPDMLERLLRSIRDNSDLDAIDQLVVVDDSRVAENSARNRAVTSAVGAGAAAVFNYFGADEACEFLQALVWQLPQHGQAIRFLLDRERWREHKSYGLARNFSQLLSVGKPVVVFDDDVLCEAWDVPFRKPGVAFANGQQEFAAFADQAEWRAMVTPHGRDPVAAHLQCLGLGVPEALAALGLERLDGSALRPASLDLARRLSRNSCVLITECGSLGDPGTGTNRWLAHIPPASRERLLQQPGRMQHATQRRCCWLGREQPEFHPTSTISQITGFDNRGYLPPYFPVMRGEDRLFGQMVSYIYPGSVALEYPWAAPHLPLPEREWTPQDNSYAISAYFPGTLVNSLLKGGDDCLAEEPRERVAFLGRLLEDLAAAPDEMLLSRLLDDRHSYRASQLRRLRERVAQAAAQPADWRSYIEDALRQVESSRLAGVQLEELKGTVGDLQGRELLKFWRSAWSSFGHALPAWEDIRGVAAEIVAKDYPD
jgi:hypothetical protein